MSTAPMDTSHQHTWVWVLIHADGIASQGKQIHARIVDTFSPLILPHTGAIQNTKWTYRNSAIYHILSPVFCSKNYIYYSC